MYHRIDSLHRTFEGFIETCDELNLLIENVCSKYERLKTHLKPKSRFNESPLTPSNVDLEKDVETLIKEQKIISINTLVDNIQPIGMEINTNKEKEEEEDDDEEFTMDRIYPLSSLERFQVDSKYKSWSVKWKKYSPVKYTSQVALLRPEADLDLVS